jgi:hypothetical protein
MLDGVRLDENSSAFTVISWHDQLCLAWTGTDLHVNLASSPDGREIMGKQRLAHRSYDYVRIGWGARAGTLLLAPSLAGSGDQLYLAWKPGADRYIWILTDPEDPHGALAQLEKVRSHLGPALCSHQGSLVLAWTAGDRRIHILTGPENPHGAPVRLEEARSGFGPALCSHQGSLILAWSGTGRYLNLARLQ